jgi:nicotinate phosphoribosyltransferase
MHQFIWRNYPNTHVSFSVTNRTKTVRLAEEIDLDELRAQLDHVRTLRFQHNELIWLAGNTFYGQEGIFGTGYLDYLRASFKLSDYDLTTNHDNGQINLTFSGPWVETTLWELYGLTIINELRYRQKMKSMKASQLDIMYARAKVKLYAKLERLNTLPDLNLTDFGTRRRHSFLWQEHAAMTACEVLGAKMTGTSNALLAMKHGLEAKGTNAHELPMVLAALAKTDEQVKAAQYRVLQQWQEDYRGNLLVFLPDTFGTTQFLKHAPQWVDYWVGARPDSKNAFLGGEELIDWWDQSFAEAVRKAGPVQRWPRRPHRRLRAARRRHRRHLRTLQRAGSRRFRLGHHADQRFHRLPPARPDGDEADLAGLQGLLR